MATYPSFSTILEGPDKGQLLIVKRAIRSILPLVFWFVGSLLLVFVVCDLYESYDLENSAISYWVTPRWLALIPALFLLEILRKRFNDLYVFTDQRIQQFHGRISLSYSVPTITYIDIRSIAVEQSIWGRILDYGDILLGTAAQADNEMTIKGVVSPLELSKIIEQFRSEAEKSYKVVGGSAAN